MTGSDSPETTDQWGAAAEHWARAAEKDEVGASADAAKWMLQVAELQPGERVLEVAGGAGRVGLQAAAEVGSEGSVLCSDFSEEMVRVARERFERLGASNIETRALDAQNLDLDEAAFDAVLCCFGYMLMPDPLQALRESAGAGSPGPFALGDPARLHSLLDRAALTDVEVEKVAVEQFYDSLEAWWEKILSVGGPLKAVLDPLPEAKLNTMRDAVLASGREFVTDDGSAVFPATVLGARARKPS